MLKTMRVALLPALFALAATSSPTRVPEAWLRLQQITTPVTDAHDVAFASAPGADVAAARYVRFDFNQTCAGVAFDPHQHVRRPPRNTPRTTVRVYPASAGQVWR